MLNRWIAMLACAGLLCAQRPDQKRFQGTWEAKFNGQVFCTIKLEAGNEINGTFSLGDIRVDDDGELMEASSAQETAAILHPKIEGERLSFEVKDGDENEPMKLAMRVEDERHGELHFVNSPSKIKPILLVRNSRKTDSPPRALSAVFLACLPPPPAAFALLVKN